MGDKLTDFVGCSVRGNSLVLQIQKHRPARPDDHFREVVVPFAVLQNDTNGSNADIDALNGGRLPFEVHVRRYLGDGPVTYDVVFGERPAEGDWPEQRPKEVDD